MRSKSKYIFKIFLLFFITSILISKNGRCADLLVIYPNGNERLLPGSSQEILWQQSGVNNVMIEYSTDNGTTWQSIDDNVDATIGYYNWEIPSNEYFECLVRITNMTSPFESDQSDNSFSISRVLWKTNVDGGIFHTPTIGEDGTIYIISYDDSYGYLSAIDTDGSLKWKNSLGYCRGNTQPPIIGDDGTIYAGTDLKDGGNLYAFNYDGSIKWEYEISCEAYSLGINGIIYVAAHSYDGLYAFDNTGNILWNSKDRIWEDIITVTSNGSFFTGSTASPFGLYEISPNGIFDRVIPTEKGVYSPSIGDDFTLYTATTDINDEKYVYAFNKDGTLKWKYEPEFRASAPTIDNEGTIYFGTTYSVNDQYEKYIYALNPDGTLKWKETIDGNAMSPTISEDGNLYLTTSRSVYSFRKDGTFNWKYDADDYIYYSPPALFNGVLYGGWGNDVLLALDSGTEAELDNSPWPIVNHDLRNTNRSNIEIEPFISLFSPNGDEHLIPESQHDITWYSSYEIENVIIEYSKDNGNTWNLITPNVIGNNKTHQWTIPDIISSFCKVKISDVSNPSLFDISDSPFTIAPELYIQLIGPNGGEEWIQDTVQNISWNSKGLSNVKIEYSIDNGVNWSTITSQINAATQTFPWRISASPSSSCIIRVSDISNTSLTDQSDQTFNILAPEISIAKTFLNFGNVNVNDTKTITFSILNEGSSTLNISRISSNNDVFNVSPLSTAIEKGDEVTVSVTYSPKTYGVENGIITIESNDHDESKKTVSVSGEGLAPEISCSSTTIAIGDVDVDNSGTGTFVITNEGNKDLTVSSINSNTTTFTTSPSSAIIAAGQTKTITVTFNPVDFGSQVATITITSNDADEETVTVSATGTGKATEIALSKTSLIISDVDVGSSGTESFVITNEGNKTLTINSITCDNPVFLVSPASASLPPGESQNITVTFSPMESGVVSGSLKVVSDDIDEGTLTISMSGTGVTPEITLSVTTISFGDVDIGSSVTETFVITNEGNKALTVSSITSDNPTFSVEPTSATVVVGDSLTVTAIFNSIEIGEQDASITIESDDNDEGTLIIQVSGTGRGTEISLSSTSITFDDVDVGSSSTLTFEILNNGNVPLSVTSISIDNGVFSIDTPSATVNAGQSTTITVTFSPMEKGEQSTTITIVSDEKTIMMHVSGIGISPDIELSTNSLSLGEVEVGSSRTDTFVINNEGNKELIVSSINSSNGAFNVDYLSETIKPDGSQTVTVNFSPEERGEYTGTIRIVSNDSDEDTLAVSVSGVGYRLCQINISLTEGEQSSDIPVTYSIIELDNLNVSLFVEYSIDDGKTWHSATIEGELLNIRSINFSGSFVWKSVADLSGYDGEVILRITPNNGIDGIPSTNQVYVDNNAPPVLSAEEMSKEYSGIITIVYDVTDAENDSLRITLEYSLDGGKNYNSATFSGYEWNTMTDINYSYQQETYLRLIANDNDPGNKVIIGPFTVTNHVGDYNHDFAIDGDDLPYFIDAWNNHDTSMEIGPVTGIPPELIVQNDGIFDFEDLTAFGLMWNWYTLYVAEKGVVVFKQSQEKVEQQDKNSIVNIVPLNNGRIQIVCDIKLDYMKLLIEPMNNEQQAVIGFSTDYWTEDDNGVVFTRTYNNGVFEIASALLDYKFEAIIEQPYIITTLSLRDDINNVSELVVHYKVREYRNKIISTGTASISGERIINKPFEFELMQNIPNPFNPITTIEYMIPVETHVSLVIYNVSGQQVAILKNDIEASGKYATTWDATGLPSGIYFYRLRTGEFNETRKMMLMK